jgi:DNA replication protein DnaC
MEIRNKCKICGSDIILGEDLKGIPPQILSSIQICSEDCKKVSRQQEVEKEQNKRFKMLSSKFPKIYKTASMADFDDTSKDYFVGSNGANRTCREAVKSWILSDYWCFFMKGSVGVGKTRLAFVTLAELARVGYTDQTENTDFGYIKANQLGMSLEAERFDDIRKRHRGFINADALFIDDLGTENKTHSDWITNLMDEREQEAKKTIITTNLDNNDIAIRYGARFLSRIEKGIIEKKGINRR